MKRQLLAALLVVLVLPTVQADNQGVDNYTTHTQTGVGQVQTQTWTVVQPTQRPEGTVAHIGVTIATATAGSWTIAIEASALEGCTIVTPITTSTSSFGGTARIQLTLTGDDCHGTIRLTGTSGSMVAKINAKVSILTSSDDDLSEVSRFAYGFAAIYFVITRFIRGPYASILRLIFDVVGFGLLQLPDLPPQQYARIASALYAVLAIDALQLLRSGDA